MLTCTCACTYFSRHYVYLLWLWHSFICFQVAEAVSRLSSLPLKDLRLIRDKLTNTSRGFCFVELNSTEASTPASDVEQYHPM